MLNRRPLIFFLLIFLVTTMALLPSVAFADWMPQHSTVVTEALRGTHPGSDWIHILYKNCVRIVNVIAFLILLIVAFSNILHINIETYSIKKILPQLVIALVVANIALPVISIFSSIIDSLHQLSLFKPLSWSFTYIVKGFGSGFQSVWASFESSFSGGWAGLSVVKTLLATISSAAIMVGLAIPVILISAFIMLLLSLILAFRPYIIFLAAAISPIAIMLSVLPQTQQWFKRWLGIIIPWMIMPLAVYFLLNIGDSIVASVDNFIIPGSGFIGTLIGIWMPLLIKVGLVFLAVRFPFTIEKDISSIIGKIGNYAGKAGWVGVGWGAEATSKKLGRNLIEKANEGETTAMKALSGDRKSIEAVQKTRLAQLQKIQKSAQEKIKANKQNDLTEEERKYGSMNDTQLRREAYKYASGADIGLSEDERKIREREIRKSLEIDALRASAIPPQQRTSEEAKLANLHTDPDAMNQEIAKRLQEFETLMIEERKAERAASFGGVYAGEWQSTARSARAAQFIRTWNPYGIMGTIRSRMEASEKEMQKEYDKYSRISAIARGNLLDTKYHQGIVKEDLGELPTAEQMMDYCRGSMKKFYSNVRNHLERQGITGLSDEEVVRIGNRFLKRFRTDVKGTKDYVAHPYFWGLSNREAATVIEGDYNISRQMAIEMRRRDRTVEDAELEREKIALYSSGGSETSRRDRTVEDAELERKKIALYSSGGSETSKGQTAATRESEQAMQLRQKRTEDLLLNIERAIRANPTQDPTALARAVAASSQLGGLNADDFERRNIEIVIPQIAQRAQELNMNIDVNTALQQGRALGTQQIETTMNASGITDEKMRSLLREYTTNAIASTAIAGSAASGQITADAAKKVVQSTIPPELLGNSTQIILTERGPE